jgi:prophage endopeptidase
MLSSSIGALILKKIGPYGQLIFIVGLVLLVSGLTWKVADWRYSSEISAMKTDRAEAVAAAEKSARHSLELAQQRGDTLSEKLAQTESALNHKTLEVSREVSRLAVGRNCLSADLVSLLNQSTASSGVATPSASAPVAADATNFASDQDVGQWILFANNQYETCSARLDALIDFNVSPLPQDDRK